MAVITKQRERLSSLVGGFGSRVSPSWILIAIELAAVYGLSRRSGWLWLAAAVVLAVELWGLRPGAARPAAGRGGLIWQRVPGVLVGLSTALIIDMVPRLVTQRGLAVLYAGWLVWREVAAERQAASNANLLIVQAVMFEAIFLMAAIWQTSSLLVLLLVWAGAYLSVYADLTRRGDRLAGVMAATWGVIAAEVAWVLQLWLITYTMRGGYVLVPQPALILTALAYLFGSILTSARAGSLSRARLAEYMVIAVVLVAIVVAGTSWRGNV